MKTFTTSNGKIKIKTSILNGKVIREQRTMQKPSHLAVKLHKRGEQQEYLDNLYILESQLCDGRISLEQFDEKINFLKTIYQEEV